MNKTIIAGLLTSSLVFGIPAHATGKWSVHLDAGVSKYDDDKQLNLSDDSDSALSAGIGYNFSDKLSLELSYNDFGAVVVNRTDLEFSSISLAVIGGVPLNNKLTLTGKLGIERLKGESNVSINNAFVNFGFNVEETSTKGFAGVGLNYAINDTLSIRSNLDLHDSADIKVLSAGVKYTY